MDWNNDHVKINHIRTMGQRCKGEFIDTTFPVAKREPEKIQACMGFKPFTFSVKGGVLYQLR